mmetsp:Transcript_541/g.1271  ORF Transcript_541/g.1271 Transcript_541/m.1271 type:complete len:567 (-) Transcript_541:2721-4421(-)
MVFAALSLTRWMVLVIAVCQVPSHYTVINRSFHHSTSLSCAFLFLLQMTLLKDGASLVSPASPSLPRIPPHPLDTVATTAVRSSSSTGLSTGGGPVKVGRSSKRVSITPAVSLTHISGDSLGGNSKVQYQDTDWRGRGEQLQAEAAGEFNLSGLRAVRAGWQLGQRLPPPFLKWRSPLLRVRWGAPSPTIASPAAAWGTSAGFEASPYTVPVSSFASESTVPSSEEKTERQLRIWVTHERCGASSPPPAWSAADALAWSQAVTPYLSRLTKARTFAPSASSGVSLHGIQGSWSATETVVGSSAVCSVDVGRSMASNESDVTLSEARGEPYHVVNMKFSLGPTSAKAMLQLRRSIPLLLRAAYVALNGLPPATLPAPLQLSAVKTGLLPALTRVATRLLSHHVDKPMPMQEGPPPPPPPASLLQNVFGTVRMQLHRASGAGCVPSLHWLRASDDSTLMRAHDAADNRAITDDGGGPDGGPGTDSPTISRLSSVKADVYWKRPSAFLEPGVFWGLSVGREGPAKQAVMPRSHISQVTGLFLRCLGLRAEVAWLPERNWSNYVLSITPE